MSPFAALSEPGRRPAKSPDPQGHIRLWPIVAIGLALGIAAALPLFAGDSAIFLASDLMIMSLFACSFNLMFGKAGMLSFGHAVFYGGGAYTVALLQARAGLGLIPALLVAPLITTLAALALGLLTIRVSGMIFAMVTLAFGQLVYTLATALYSFTGGDDGLGVTLPNWMLRTGVLYELVFLVVVACIALLYVISNSAFGMALEAIQDNPQRAAFSGLNVRMYRLAAFVIAGGFAGVSGALRVLTQQMAFPTLLHWSQSAEPLLMSLIGGADTFLGPVVGATFFVLLNFFLTSTTDYPLLVFGLAVLFTVLFMPRGIAGSLEQILRRTARAST